MIRVAFKRGLLGEGDTTWHQVDWSPGITYRDLRAKSVEQFPMCSVLAAVDGVELADDEQIPDGSTVVVCLRTDATFLGYVVYAIVSAIVSLAVNYVISLLSPTPTPPGLGQDRGTDSSPTYAWDAIQTSYGQGQTIAVVLGRHAVGGQVIASRVGLFGSERDETLSLVLALCEGPVRRIGNQVASINELGAFTLFPGAPALPIPKPIQSGLFINDNLIDSSGTVIPEIKTWLRKGTLSQSALPVQAFPGASTLFTINQPLNDAGEKYQWTYNDTDELSAVLILLRAPAGAYTLGAGGTVTVTALYFSARWRYLGESTWRQFGVQGPAQIFGGNSTTGRSFGATLYFNGSIAGSVPIAGPIQIEVERITPAGSVPNDVTAAILRSVELIRPQQFAYPGLALMGVSIRSTSTFSGGLPRFRQEVDGHLVRAWDEETGFSSRIWDTPEAGQPYDWALTPGRSPAWLLGELLTNKRWGLGNEIGDERVDWPALRRWAAYCQSVPNGGWSDPRYTCDLVLDSLRPSWESVVRLCWAGGAAAIWKGGKVSIVYQYRDAHSDGGGLSVAAKAPVQLINSALCENVTVRWLPKAGRATSIDFQYLDETQGFAQNVLPVEDVESTVQDPTDPQSEPFISQVIQAYGVTRLPQLVRMGFRSHRTTRLTRRELTFECGPWMLAGEVGDLVDFQHDMLRPFSDGTNANLSTAMQVVDGDVSSDNRVIVDHLIDVDEAASLLLSFAARSPSGAPIYSNINAATATTYRGRPATLLFLDDDITVDAGAACLVGYRDKLVETYQVASITLQQDMRRQVRLLQWVPGVFDDVPSTFADKDYDKGTLLKPANDGAETTVVLASSVTVELTPDGRQRVAWSLPDESPEVEQTRTGSLARVYMRPANSGPFVLVGETANGWLELAAPFTSRTVEVAVSMEDAQGNYTPPLSSTTATAIMPEFPPHILPAPDGLEFVQDNTRNRLLLSWSRSTASDVIGYEIRAGSHWSNGPVLWRGDAGSVELSPAPAMPTLQIAAVHKSGMHGRRTLVSRTVSELPYAGANLIASTEFAPSNAGGTHDGTQFAATVLELQPGEWVGTFTTTEVVLGFSAEFFLRLALEVRHQDNATVEELAAMPAATGEALWRTVDARPASPLAPGINWRRTINDIAATPVSQLGNILANGLQMGEAGAHVDAYLESRTYRDGAWSDWEPHRDRSVVCERWQARCRLGRDNLTRTVQLSTLRLEALL
mgnify:CR=1 FL=1